jgi:CubicO group peptidase (beta-lactamase class C family)
VRSLSDQHLIADPGQRFAYSNTAYEVLGDVIAHVSQTTFEDYVQRCILEPLGMTHSTLTVADAEQSLVARGHTLGPDGEVIEREVYPYNRAHAPSSTLVASIRDLGHWAAMLLNHGHHNGVRIVGAATLEQMWTPRVAVHPKLSTQVGLSWFIERYRGQRIVQHSGSDEGFQSHLVVAPEARIAAFAMCNADFQHVFAPHIVTRAVLELLLGPQPA